MRYIDLNGWIFFQLFFAEQFFKLFDKDRSGTISLSELIDGLNTLMEGSDMDKLKFLFDVYDVDGMVVSQNYQILNISHDVWQLETGQEVIYMLR